MFSPRTDIIVILFFGILALSLKIGRSEDCVPRDFGYGSIVCVCNSTYCDSTERNVPKKGQYGIYESGKDGKRMSRTVGSFVDHTRMKYDFRAIKIFLNLDTKFQKIHGFGGAFTDSAGINIKKMSEKTQNRIVETYFGSNGSRYNLGRVPAGGTDFSTRGYSYDDTKDVKLEKFALAEEDIKYKIPIMQKALKTNPSLRFVSTSWTAPPWMKTNNDYLGYGFLKEEYYQTYADYLVKFLVEYKKHGLKIWAISTGNEPMNIYIPIINISNMGWTPKTVGNWIAHNLGPSIEKSESNDTLILIIEDERVNLPWYVVDIFKNPLAKNYTAGIAVHLYMDTSAPPEVLDNTAYLYPEKFLLLTEGCVGSLPTDIPKVRLGDWERGQSYILDIMENLNHWMTGWMEWNLALDKTGGPNWNNNFVDSSIIVNPETDEFFKQPTYYALAHFSKFITRGSMRIGTTKSIYVQNVAFLTMDDEIVIVLYNGNNENKKVIVRDPQHGNILTNIPPYSIQTVIYKR